MHNMRNIWLAEDLEKEHRELLATVERYAAEHKEALRLEWENNKRTQEVRELQKASHNNTTCLIIPIVKSDRSASRSG